jgi:hypothetical protein
MRKLVRSGVADRGPVSVTWKKGGLRLEQRLPDGGLATVELNEKQVKELRKFAREVAQRLKVK